MDAFFLHSESDTSDLILAVAISLMYHCVPMSKALEVSLVKQNRLAELEHVLKLLIGKFWSVVPDTFAHYETVEVQLLLRQFFTIESSHFLFLLHQYL